MKKKLLLLTILSLGILSTKAQVPGNSLHFIGFQDRVNTTLPTVFTDLTNNDFTMELWVKPEGGTSSQRFIFAQFSATTFANILINSSNEIYFYVNNNSGSVTANTPVTLNQWTHIACTWDASTQQRNIYFNGVLQTTTLGGSTTTGTNNTMTLGSKTDGAQYFIGEMDEVRIWDVVRTECEIFTGMTTEFTVAQPNLVAYYNFNQGTPGGNNAGVTTLPDFTGNYDGTLLNFALTSTNSNWVSSGANITTLNQNGSVDTSLTVAVPNITANASTAIYQWLDCSNGNAVITGETNQTFIASTNGSYAVEITQGSCVDTSACVPISITGLSDNTTFNNINIYPNPTQSQFTINGMASTYSLELYNSLGQLLFSEANIVVGSKQVDVGAFDDGLIIIRLVTETGVTFKQLMKQ